jgi:hypothetical protein
MEENKNSPPPSDDSLQQEPQLNTPSADETIAPSETSTEVEPQPETSNKKPETEQDMEVHHHAHDPAAPHHKKNWKSYFWEFLMLFLAVFCGFLAEYQLEHVIENQREEKYAASFLEDIKKDTAYLNGEIPYWKDLLIHMDTIRAEIEKPSSVRNNLSLYKSMSYIRTYSNFEYHDRTIEQLKNGGNFRLIKKSIVADSIIDYDASIKSILRDQESQSNDIYRNLNYLQDKILNSKYFYDAVNNPKFVDSIFKNNPNAFIISAQKESELFEYYNRLQFYRQITSYRVGSLNRINRRATNLIKLIKTEYHLN